MDVGNAVRFSSVSQAGGEGQIDSELSRRKDLALAIRTTTMRAQRMAPISSPTQPALPMRSQHGRISIFSAAAVA